MYPYVILLVCSRVYGLAYHHVCTRGLPLRRFPALPTGGAGGSLPSASSSHLFGHGQKRPLAPSPSGRGQGVRAPVAGRDLPLTLTLSRRARGQETMAKEVI